MAVDTLCREELTASVTTLYTSENAKTQITAATASNKTASPVTVSVYIVDAGGAAADANALIVEDLNVPANSVVGIPELIGQALRKSETIQAAAGAGNAITLFVSGSVGG